MKVKEIVLAAATLTGSEKVTAYLEGGEGAQADGETLAAADKFVRLCNIVISELAGSYIPMVRTERVTAVNGRIYFTSLSMRALKIRAVYDASGRKLFYTLHPEYIEPRGSAAQAEYEYLPDNLGLTDETGYTEKDITAGVLSYGLAAEYCLAEGRFEEAVLWRKRYAEGVMSFALPRGGVIKSRCFI